MKTDAEYMAEAVAGASLIRPPSRGEKSRMALTDLTAADVVVHRDEMDAMGFVAPHRNPMPAPTQPPAVATQAEALQLATNRR